LLLVFHIYSIKRKLWGSLDMVNTDHVGAVVAWRRSARCGESGTCVEVAQIDQGIAVRDSKNPDSPTLFFDRSEWEVFVAGIRSGDFDAL